MKAFKILFLLFFIVSTWSVVQSKDLTILDSSEEISIVKKIEVNDENIDINEDFNILIYHFNSTHDSFRITYLHQQHYIFTNFLVDIFKPPIFS